MRRTSKILSTASAIAIALGAAPVMAQESGPATPPDPTVQAQEQPADREAGSAETDDAVQTATGLDQAVDPAAADNAIVVTGLRRSLRSAQNIKRNSEQIVDAIVAEDIGKLPDIAVSDTAARIPGVQVLRTGGEASTVLIRGLPDFTTTYNGREIFTGETRFVALQDFPSSNIAALEVFKTTTANLVEAGIAGLVNVRSRRPFDFKGLEIAGSAWALNTRQAREVTPNGNFLVSNRWNTGAGEVGALINLSYTRLQFLDSEPSNTDFIADPTINGQQVRFPDIQRLFYRSGDRTRPSVNATVQWRASDALELYAEGLYQGFRNKISDRLFAQPLYGGSSYTDLDFRDGTNLLSGGTVVSPVRGDGFQGGTLNKTNTYQFAIGGRYEAGPLKLTADLARTRSKFTGSTESVDFRVVPGYTVVFDNETPEFELVGFDRENPANYIFNGFYEERQVSEGDDYQARVDADYDSGLDFLPKIEAGVRFTTRDAHREFGNRFAGFDERYAGGPVPITSVPLNYKLFQSGFRGTDVQSGFTNFLTPTYGSIRRRRDELRQFVVDLGTPDPRSFGSFLTDEPVINPSQTFDADEDSLAGYAQADYRFGDTIDGTIGLRAVRDKVRVRGNSVVEGVLTPVDSVNKRTALLPNVSLRWHATPELQVRLSATRTRTRPTFRQLNPAATLGPPGNQQNPTDPYANARIGFGGNPDLEPFTSNNYDASVEYYFSRNGFAALGLFRRNVEGFIQNTQIRRIDADLGPVIIDAPTNSGKGRIQGLEAQAQTFFDYEFFPAWARNFGVQANYTYIDEKAEFLNPVTGEFENGRILLPTPPDGPGGGISKHTYNLAAFYEGGGLSARLSYNKRGKYLDQRQFRTRPGPTPGSVVLDDLYLQEAKPAGRLDLSTSYAVNDSVTMFFDWTNITQRPFRVNFSSARNGAPRAEYVRFLRFDETTLSFGVRARFGGLGGRAARPEPAYVAPPPPPPPPVVEQPAPPPPPPPATSGERGQ